MVYIVLEEKRVLAMSKLVIEGQNRLNGEICIHGAKNSALPVLAATIMCDGESVIHNCPALSDVDASIKILKHLGCIVKEEKDCVIINSKNISRWDIPDCLMHEMRSSVVFLGAIASRMGRARISFPGGCELGPRPIDLHINALRKMGLFINEFGGYLDCEVIQDRLKGTKIALSFPSVGATENIMFAAVLADGITTISNAAREPEIIDVADFLNACGAKISGAGGGVITIEGVKKLNGAEHKVIPDRIEATTFMAAAAITKGNITVRDINISNLDQVIPMFEEAGCSVKTGNDYLRLVSPEKLRAIKVVRTMPYPGFPTDAQAPIMAITTLSDGTCVFIENIFESRYKHVSELLRLGANIKVEGKVAVVEGVNKLVGASVESPDLRGAAALVIAGLAAEGTTEISGLNHLDRGYEKIEEQLESLGANIKRV